MKKRVILGICVLTLALASCKAKNNSSDTTEDEDTSEVSDDTTVTDDEDTSEVSDDTTNTDSEVMEKGLTPFGMQRNPICKWITGSKFMRITYAVAKVVAFIVIIASKIPYLEAFSGPMYRCGYWLALIAIILCVVRGLPVVIEAKTVIEDDNA